MTKVTPYLYEQMSKIRNLINTPRKQHILLKDRAMWDKLCNAMDAIEDTEKVLEDFFNEDVDRADKSMEYLPAYDVFDSLIKQQTSIERLHESLKIPYTKDSSLQGMLRSVENIRQICIDTLKNKESKRPITTNITDLMADQRHIFGIILKGVLKPYRVKK